MPFHTSEFIAETAHLNTTQTGAYALLLIHYWHKRGLPTADEQLARITRLSLRGWLNLKPILQLQFCIVVVQTPAQPDERRWTHPRLDHELARADLLHAKRAGAGSKGGNRKAMNALPKQSEPLNIQKGVLHTRTNLLKPKGTA